MKIGRRQRLLNVMLDTLYCTRCEAIMTRRVRTLVELSMHMCDVRGKAACSHLRGAEFDV